MYLSDCVSAVSALSGRYRLRSTGSADYILPRTRTRLGERGFSYCGPAAWNTLPSDLHDITDTSTFRKRLKSVLYDRAYHWLLSWTCRIAAPYKFYVDWLIDWLNIRSLHVFETSLTATATRAPYGTTQCGDISAFAPAEAGTRFSDDAATQGWVDLVGWLHTEMIYRPEVGHPSQY